MVRFTLLGPVRVLSGEPEAALTPTQCTVLAALLLRAGHVVSVAALARAIWDDVPPPSARTTIQGHIKRLRQLLGPASERIVTRAPGYLIVAHPGELDECRFTELRSQAGSAAQAGEWGRAADLLRDALAQWTGEPLANVPSGFLRRTEVPRLAELRLEAQEARIEADMRLGRNEAGIAELRALVSGHPFRERFWELLMLALYRAGRQADALSAYQQARDALRESLGIDPGQRLQRLQAQVLSADPELDTDEPPARDHPLRTQQITPQPHVVPSQLLADLPDFTGRAPEASALRQMLLPFAEGRPGVARVVTVSGPGGIGKTTLALHVAHGLCVHFPDGQLFISLGGAASPAAPGDVLDRLLRDLGVPDSRMPAGEDERAALFRTLAADRAMLIVLDDAHSSAQVRSLLPGSGDSAVIVTSRAALADLPGSRFAGLTALAADESLELFTAIVGERARKDPAATGDVLASCAGLPLAIRIAGSRLATQPRWSVGQLAALLASEQRRLGELAAGDTAVRASFEVSYLSLPPGSPGPAQVFRRYGLSGLRTLSLPALAALAGEPVGRTAAAVTALVNAHLLESPAPDQFQAHDLLRLYAAEQAASGETCASRRAALLRLLAWYQHTLNACVRHFNNGRKVPLEPLPGCVPEPEVATLANAVDWLRAESGNLIQAVRISSDQHMDDPCWRLAWLMHYYYAWSGRRTEYLSVTTIGLRAAQSAGNKAAAAALLNGMGAAHWKLGQPQAAAECYERSCAIRRELGDRQGEAAVLSNLGLAELESGNMAAAIGRFTKALAFHRELGHHQGEAYSLQYLGQAHESAHRSEEALRHYQQALAIRTAHGYLHDQAGSLHSIGALLLAMGRTEEALDNLRQSLAICREAGLQYGEGMTLASLGDGYAALGKPSDARDAWQQAYDILNEVGAPEAARCLDRMRLGRWH